MKKALVIYSPSAGKIKSGQTARIVRKKMESLGYRADWFVLDDGFEGMIRDYDFSKIKTVVAMGGDGTVKVAGRIILQNDLKIPLGIIPSGSANVIAQELKLPFKITEAIKLLARPEKFALLDAGIINNKHYFFVGFSLGHVSEVVAKTAVGLKKKLGFLGYFLSLISSKTRLKTFKF
ncbi:MAG: diacylglycerol kinase family protein, partial [Patescibacteria group bacterium]